MIGARVDRELDGLGGKVGRTSLRWRRRVLRRERLVETQAVVLTNTKTLRSFQKDERGGSKP
jgi:hypothetical protein